jgi:hypothetical protein
MEAMNLPTGTCVGFVFSSATRVLPGGARLAAEPADDGDHFLVFAGAFWATAAFTSAFRAAASILSP